MNDYLTRLTLRIAKRPLPEYLMHALVRLVRRLNPDLLFSTLPEQFPLDTDRSLAARLDEIPSETSPAERRFLYRYFSMLWGGDDDVIEIGPFLGGTTRAIALGMCANPLASARAKLYTYDRFHGYYDMHRLKQCLAPLVAYGPLEQSDLIALNGAAEFMDIFRKIHAPHDYYERIVPVSSELPSRADDLKDAARYFHMGEHIRTQAVFVDGCKSWFGTKHFMGEVSKAARRGATFIFQDYGWHTCFWIPAFTELLRDYLLLVGRVHTTYVFKLTKSLDLDAIDARFPDTPQEIGAVDLVQLFDRLVVKATSRNDSFAVVRHRLQSAGALAYVGEKEKAREVISSVKSSPWARGHEKIIAAASRSPTYSPEGAILLDQER